MGGEDLISGSSLSNIYLHIGWKLKHLAQIPTWMTPKVSFSWKKRRSSWFSLPPRLPQLTVAIELVSEISRQLNDRKSEAVAEITGTFEELERALHQRKTALITDLENICTAKQKAGYQVSTGLTSDPLPLLHHHGPSLLSIHLNAGPAGSALGAPPGEGAHPKQLQLHGASPQPRQRHRGGPGLR